MQEQILKFFSPALRQIFNKFTHWNSVEEIRIRVGKPLVLSYSKRTVGLKINGTECSLSSSYCPTADELEKTIQLITQNSWYALEDEIRNGFVTIPGGHRVGFAGKVVMDNHKIKTIKHLSALNIRIAREVKGAGNKLVNRILTNNGIVSTLLVSPPGCGKTTLLRDIARQISNNGCNVLLVDERSEIAACYQGIPQLDIGIQTDVLDGCPKALGINLGLRSLAPQVIITDEVGHPDDAVALADAVKAGVKVIASCHGSSLSTVKKREWLRQSFAAFEQTVLLSRRNGPGTIEKVLKFDN